LGLRTEQRLYTPFSRRRAGVVSAGSLSSPSLSKQTNAESRRFAGDESFKDMATGQSMLDTTTRVGGVSDGRRAAGSRGKL
jgi:hypothetical protein